MKQIILTGSISIDRIMNFSGKYREVVKPDKLHVLSLSVLIDSLVDSYGGTAANIAYNLALLEEQPVLLCSIGEREQGYLERLEKLGIETKWIHKSSLPTATFTVLTDTEDNQVGGFYPGAMAEHESLELAEWRESESLVVISANDPGAMSKFVKEAKEYMLPYVYDVGQQVSNISAEEIREGVEGCEILIVNDYELGVITEKMGLETENIEAMVPIVIETLGAEGSIAMGNEVGEKIRVKAVENVEVLDPTGAGDSYRSGFLYGYVRNWEIEKCMQLGSIMASYVVCKKGTQEHVFDKEGINEISRKTYNKIIFE